ncbi:hypothetical protein ACO2Q9_09810 [Variovorax sp. VNK109]|uniref:hypothetical protein n=1 Tax=Variovorax sp. VNK109 TaxID=3400919 RepID=UPI003C0869D7
MKFIQMLGALTAAMALAGAAHAAGSHGHEPKRGGIVVETKSLDLEVVAKPDLIQIYAEDHGKAVDLAGAKAKVTLLNGTEKSEVELVPVGDKLEAKGTFKIAKGTKGIATVNVPKRAASTGRFEVK